MRRIWWGTAIVLAAGLLVAELAMDLDPSDRRRLYLVFVTTTAATLLAAVISLRLAGRAASLRTSLIVVAFAAVAVTGGVVAVASVSMFIDGHDLSLVLVAIVLGVGLGGVVAGSVGRQLTSDLAAMSETASRVAEGDLAARTGIDRGDELGAAAQAIDQMVTRLQTAEEERRQLLSAIGHDLRTPLGSMQAALEALQDGVAPDPPSYLRGMSHDLEHLRRLVDDLFLLARIESGSLELTLVYADLTELADEAVEAVAPAADREKVRLVVDSPGHIGVTGDPAGLGRVFRNLLSNAVRHSPEHGTVRVVMTQDGTHAVTTVVDQGEGFPESLRDRAFDRFTRLDDSRSRSSGGSGLGLAIARGIVEAHGGSISIGEGPGGRVVFTVPLS